MYSSYINTASDLKQHCGETYKMSNPCLICTRKVRRNRKAMECDGYKRWCHIRCGINISNADYNLVVEGNILVVFERLNKFIYYKELSLSLVYTFNSLLWKITGN